MLFHPPVVEGIMKHDSKLFFSLGHGVVGSDSDAEFSGKDTPNCDDLVVCPQKPAGMGFHSQCLWILDLANLFLTEEDNMLYLF